MLQSMRHLAHSWPVKGLMLFLMISFSIWGIGDIFRGNPLQKSVATAGRSEISVQQLNHLFEESLARARQVNPDLTAHQARQMGVLDKTLDNEVKRLLVDQNLKQLGIDVPPQAVLKLLADQPQFRTRDGKFNKELFQQLLQQQGRSETSFIADGQIDLARQLLVESLAGSRSAPQTAVDALYKAGAQKRILDVVTIDSSKITGIGEPDDKALHSFYDQNQSLFTSPEYRGLTIAVLSTDTLTKTMRISDDQLLKDYDENGDQFKHAEQRDIIQSVMQDEAKARQLAQAAQAGGNLEAAAKARAVTAVPLENLEEKNLMPELAKIVFSLPQGKISDPIKTQLGWHVLQIKKIIPAGKTDFAAVKEKLRDDMQRNQGIEAATRLVNQLDDELAAGHTLEDIAESMHLRLIKIPAVDAKGLTPTDKEPGEFPDRQKLLADAFALNKNENSVIEDDKAGNYYVVHIDQITPATAKPFEQVKATIAALWRAHEQQLKAQAEADKIAQGLREGKPANSFLSQDGASVRTSMPISLLGDTDPLLPGDIVTQALKLKKGEVTTATSDRNQVVARLAQITEGKISAGDPRKNKIAGDIKENAGNELLDQYIAHLGDVYTVKINNERVDQLRDQE